MRNFKYTNILPDSANSIINFYTRLIHREAILHCFVYHQKLKMLIISKQNFLCNQISRFSRSIIDKTDYFSDRNSIQNFHPVCKVLSGKINRTKIRILFIIFSKVQSKVGNQITQFRGYRWQLFGTFKFSCHNFGINISKNSDRKGNRL